MIELTNLSKIGFGAYRISYKSPNDFKTLRYALRNGCNLVDTAANYMDGNSEKLIGEVGLDFKNLFIITKAGYIQGESLEQVKRHFNNSELQQFFIKMSDSFLYSLHPKYLQWQINQSLERLQRAYIDGFLLHNPEYYFKQQENKVESKIFLQIIKRAFEFLEEQVHKGIIRYYGISSNTLPLSKSSSSSIDLNNLIDIAKEVSVSNHFKIIQFPFNFNEQEALINYNNKPSLLELIKKANLLSFANRPLNSQNKEGIIRFATYEKDIKKLDQDKSKVLLDDCFHILSNKLQKTGISEDLLSFPVMKLLSNNWMKIGNPEAVQTIFNQYFYPFVEKLYSSKIPSKHRIMFKNLERNATLFSKKELTKKSEFFKMNLIEKGIIKKDDIRPLPVIACQYYLEAGMDHILVGMKRISYIKDFKDLF